MKIDGEVALFSLRGRVALNRRLLVIATLLALLVLIVADSCFLIGFTPATTTELIQGGLIAEMISKINETGIYNTVYAFQNLTTRIYGSSGNVDAATYLHNRLNSIPHLNVEYQSNLSNIIATLPGVDKTSNATYIVGAHYDSISSTGYAPGATDNSGGVAIVLEFARIMSQYSFNHTLKFAFWNCEENGQLGSTEYVKQAHDNGVNVSLYLNFDSSCYDPYNRMTLELMFNNQSSWVSEMMTGYNTLYGINFTLNYNTHTCSSDQSPFWAYGYTAVMTHSESHGPAHSPDDTIDKVSTAYAQKNGKLGMSLLAALAEAQDPTPTPTLTPASTPTSTPTPSPLPSSSTSPTQTTTTPPTFTTSISPPPIPTPIPNSSATPATPSPNTKQVPSPSPSPLLQLMKTSPYLYAAEILAILAISISVTTLIIKKKR